jgi:hypothetical protein
MVLAFVAMAIVGCAGATSGTGSAPTPTPTPGPVVVASDALARVVEHEPRLAGIRAFDSGLIGQSSWYTVEPASGVGAFW